MITQLNLQTFQCFKELQLPLAPLTLLSGSNASGKSTVLQSLVLLNQTMREHEWSDRLYLNGDTLSLGSVQDVVDKVNGRNSLSIMLHTNNSSIRWDFVGEREDLTMAIDEIHVNDQLIKTRVYKSLFPDVNNIYFNRKQIVIDNSFKSSKRVIHFIKNLNYLTAERIGPRELYPLVVSEHNPDVGPTGEHTASVLYQLRDKPVNKMLLLGQADTVLRQVELRMQQFFPHSSIAIERVANRNYVTLGLRTSPDTNYHRPNNVGFGLTQVLPIIVATLTAEKDDILLIENPEVHLHPAGQALMGQYLAEVAASGVQIILETHSDHILNGMRRAVKNGIIPHSDVRLYFFNPRYHAEQRQTAQIISPAIDRHGNIDTWPDGFFDQFDKDANYFAGWGE
jgi:predicted ATPase